MPLKQCKEVRFSNGGHLFAAASGTTGIHVYNFYTSDCPPNMHCTGHTGFVRGIDWLDDDSGFVSCAGDQTYFTELQQQRDTKQRLVDHDFVEKGISFSGLCNVPGEFC